MTHKWDKHYNKVFILLFISGVALCIAGIWVPPLLVPGGVCLTGAFAMYASAYTRMYSWRQDKVPTPVPTANIPREHCEQERPNVTINVDDHSVNFTPHFDMIQTDPNPRLEIMESHKNRLTIV